MMENNVRVKEIVDEAYELYGKEKAVEVLEREYSPYCDGTDVELWREIKSELRTRGVSLDVGDRTSMRMRNYLVTIRRLNEPGGERAHVERVLALSKRHAYERAAEQFAMDNADLDTKKWYISYENTACDD